jgi:hypothetical protein
MGSGMCQQTSAAAQTTSMSNTSTLQEVVCLRVVAINYGNLRVLACLVCQQSETLYGIQSAVLNMQCYRLYDVGYHVLPHLIHKKDTCKDDAE